MTSKFTEKQGQYLAFIYHYALLHGQAPAETDLQQYFKTSPPSVHNMVLTLERAGLITRVPRTPRSIRIAVPVSELPPLGGPKPEGGAPISSIGGEPRPVPVPRLASLVVQKLFDEYEAARLDDEDFAPLVRSVADAVEAEALEAGATSGTARATREAVLDQAVGIYVRICAENDPEGADAADDAKHFRRLMKPKT